ncbi:MAG: hypothetical protein RAP03_01100, partial [Candidatus Electryonea clarkiae]|nr:hypothetical protein [Candidatus Electryonea clarkiae]
MRHSLILMIALSIAVIFCFSNEGLFAAETSETAITIYNQNLALVRQIREMQFGKGRQGYSYDGVAAQIDPTSVHFKAAGVQVLEQNFEYDLVDNQTLLRKFIGHTVEIRTSEGTVSGVLLSDQHPLILQDNDGKVQTLSSDQVHRVNFPELPEGLVMKPTLRWDLFSEKKGNIDAELTYLTRGINWEASYVAVVSEKDDALDFSGWVQIDNNSGATYEDAKLKLMAGDVRIIQEHMGRRERKKFTAMASAEMDGLGGFEERVS